MGEREILRNLHLPVGHRGQHLILFKSLRCSGVASEIFGSCFHHDPRRHKCHKRPPSTGIHRHPGTQKFLTAQKVLRVDRFYTSLGSLDWYESRLAFPDWAATGAAGFEFDLGYVQHGGFTTYLWHFLVGTVMANHTHVQILTHVLAPFFCQFGGSCRDRFGGCAISESLQFQPQLLHKKHPKVGLYNIMYNYIYTYNILYYIILYLYLNYIILYYITLYYIILC